MFEVLMENMLEILAGLIVTLIGVFGAWLTAKLSKKAELSAINAAQQELITMAQITVGQLQQTLVEGMKAANADGKLSKADISALGLRLISDTMEKLSEPSRKLLEAAGVDILSLIRGAGEDWINEMKKK